MFREAVIDAQLNDPTLEKCCVNAEDSSLPPHNTFIYWKDAVLMG